MTPRDEDRDFVPAGAMKDSRQTVGIGLLCKLGSIVVHADEMLSAKGHHFDRVALEALLHDPEVAAWLKEMGPLVPRKRAL
jgi:hypothetical protein